MGLRVRERMKMGKCVEQMKMANDEKGEERVKRKIRKEVDYETQK